MNRARLAAALSLSAIFAAVVMAQCPQGDVVLTVTPSATNATIDVSVTGTPGAGIVLFKGSDLGETTLTGWLLNGTVICLDTPFLPIPLGQIPSGGTKTVTLPVISSGAMVHFQAVTLESSGFWMPPTVETSNTASFTPPPPPPCTPGNVQLVITPDAPVQPGNTITISVTGAPGALVLLDVSHAFGSTPVPFLPAPLCLELPIAPLFFGFIPSGGTLTRTHTVSMNAMLPGDVTLFFQAVTLDPATPGTLPEFDTSNTDSLML
jgi:hypothetical protein